MGIETQRVKISPDWRNIEHGSQYPRAHTCERSLTLSFPGTFFWLAFLCGRVTASIMLVGGYTRLRVRFGNLYITENVGRRSDLGMTVPSQYRTIRRLRRDKIAGGAAGHRLDRAGWGVCKSNVSPWSRVLFEGARPRRVVRAGSRLFPQPCTELTKRA